MKFIFRKKITKVPRRKRKVLYSIIFAMSMLVGNPALRSGKNRELTNNLNRSKYQQVILVKYDKSSLDKNIGFPGAEAGLIPVNVNPEPIEPPGNNNQVYQERLLSDQKFNSFEDNDQKVILVKTGDSSPSVPTSPGRGQPNPFPTPPSGGRPTRPSTGVNPYGIYRPTPKVVGQG